MFAIFQMTFSLSSSKIINIFRWRRIILDFRKTNKTFLCYMCLIYPLINCVLPHSSSLSETFNFSFLMKVCQKNWLTICPTFCNLSLFLISWKKSTFVMGKNENDILLGLKICLRFGYYQRIRELRKFSEFRRFELR